VTSRRQIDLHGSISACDAAGRTLQVHCAGAELKIDVDSIRAALSALAALRSLRSSGSLAAFPPVALERVNDFRIELCVHGRHIGRAGHGARANWAGRLVTKIPLELHLPALLRAAVQSF